MIAVFYWLFTGLLLVLALFCCSNQLVLMVGRQGWFQHLRVCGCVLYLAMAANLVIAAERYVHYSAATADRYNSAIKIVEAERDCVLSVAICALLLLINKLHNNIRDFSKLSNNFRAMEAQARSASAAALKQKLQ